LLETYNTSILDRSDEMFKEACVKEAKKCVDDNKDKTKPEGYSERKVLSQLIINHSIESDQSVPPKEKKPITDYIGGPKILRLLWSKRYKKLIYIFGELHSEKTNCERFFGSGINHMLIEDYLEQLFRHTDVFIDFYLETGRTYEEIYGQQRMAVMAKRFKECFHNPKNIESVNKCALFRMHYFDIRSEGEGLKPNPMSYVNPILNILKATLSSLGEEMIFDTQTNFKTKFMKYGKQIMPILQKFSGIKTEEEYEEFWNKELEDHAFLVKKVGKSKMHDKIKSFILKEIFNAKIDDVKIDTKKLIETTLKFVNIIDKFKIETDIYNFDTATEDDFSKIESYMIAILSGTTMINSCIPDYYLLSRIFKVFDLTNEKNVRITDEPVEPHNIIIYAGVHHAKRVRRFLKKRGFKDIDSSKLKDLPSNCVDIKSFQQPFFSNREEVEWNNSSIYDSEYDSDDNYDSDKELVSSISYDDLYS
jgi:hypothetical protein